MVCHSYETINWKICSRTGLLGFETEELLASSIQLRQLDNGQWLLHFAPSEVPRDAVKEVPYADIDGVDVIRRALELLDVHA